MQKRHYIICLALLVLFQFSGMAQTAQWRVRPEWQSVELLGPTLVKVEINGKFGLVRYDGGVVVEPKFDKITAAQEGYCLLLDSKYDKWILAGIVEEKSISVVKPSADYAVDIYWPYFSEGLLAVENISTGLWGYIDKSGELFIGCNYKLAFPFSNNLAAVQFKDNFFAHIHKDKRRSGNSLEPMVSHGSGDNLKHNDYLFASTFANTDNGPMALILRKKQSLVYPYMLLARDLAGNETSINIPMVSKNISQEMSNNHLELTFNDARQPVVLLDKAKGTKVEFGTFQTPKYLGTTASILSASANGGLFNMMLNGRAFLDYQFQSVLPLSDNMALVKENGKWGLISVARNETIGITLPNPTSRYNHWNKVPVAFSVRIPSSMASMPLSITVIEEDKEYQPMKQDDGNYVVDVHPGSPKFNCRIMVDGIKYSLVTTKVDMEYKNAFRVSISNTVTLNSSNTSGTVSISVINSSDSPSGPCSVWVDGVCMKEYDAIDAKGKKSMSKTVSVSLGSLDSVKKSVRVEVREENCNSYSVSQQVTFNRSFD